MCVMTEQVLITGGAGFIGSFLSDYYVEQGYSVRILDNLDAQVHPHGPPAYLNPAAELIVADVRDKAALHRALTDATVVIHAAAAVGVGQSMYKVQHYIDTNVGGTAALLEALIERKQTLRKLIVFTSMTGYGEGLYQRPGDGTRLRVGVRTQAQIDRYGWEPTDPEHGEVLTPVPTPEDAALLAQNVYALSKRYQEELALSLGEFYGIPTTCLRLFNVYGPRQALSNPYTGVLAIFLSRLLAGECPTVYEDGAQTRDFVSVHDVVQATARAVATPASNGMVFNVGSGTLRTIAEIARTLARLVGREDLEPQITGQFRKGDIRHCLADLTRLQTVLGFTPQTSWEQSLQEIIAWSATAPREADFQRVNQELRSFGIVS
jgi:dTDP-L-rhamnose 4-epimerase